MYLTCPSQATLNSSASASSTCDASRRIDTATAAATELDNRSNGGHLLIWHIFLKKNNCFEMDRFLLDFQAFDPLGGAGHRFELFLHV